VLLTLLDAQIGMGRPKEMNVELPREGEGQMSYPPIPEPLTLKFGWRASQKKCWQYQIFLVANFGAKNNILFTWSPNSVKEN